MFTTDNTKQFSDILFLASDSYRIDMGIDKLLTLCVVVCDYPRLRKRLQICLKNNITKCNYFFSGSWL